MSSAGGMAIPDQDSEPPKEKEREKPKEGREPDFGTPSLQILLPPIVFHKKIHPCVRVFSHSVEFIQFNLQLGHKAH